MTKRKTEKIVDIVMEAKETEELKREMRFLIEEGLHSVSGLQGATETLRLLMESAAEDYSRNAETEINTGGREFYFQTPALIGTLFAILLLLLCRYVQQFSLKALPFHDVF